MKNKKIIIFQVLAFLAILIVLILVGSSKKTDDKSWSKSAENPNPAEKVEVAYFHSSARCYSCVALEEYAEKVIKNNFQDELTSGVLTFTAYNVEHEENKEIIEKYQARTSSLFINAIYNGEDHIKEDVASWRYISDENKFNNYFIKEINSYLGK